MHFLDLARHAILHLFANDLYRHPTSQLLSRRPRARKILQRVIPPILPVPKVPDLTCDIFAASSVVGRAGATAMGMTWLEGEGERERVEGA